MKKGSCVRLFQLLPLGLHFLRIGQGLPVLRLGMEGLVLFERLKLKNKSINALTHKIIDEMYYYEIDYVEGMRCLSKVYELRCLLLQ